MCVYRAAPLKMIAYISCTKVLVSAGKIVNDGLKFVKIRPGPRGLHQCTSTWVLCAYIIQTSPFHNLGT